MVDVQRAVHGGGHCLQRSVGDGASDADAPDLAAINLGQDVGGCFRIVA